ncbi:hypothetical protein, partial [Ignavigranum ruoffiae]|uniref:hypothetical protein n=1 Tax=Ignavigranum ruoffiae TaxID=89093 RepID=UPI0024AD1A2E
DATITSYHRAMTLSTSFLIFLKFLADFFLDVSATLFGVATFNILSRRLQTVNKNLKLILINLYYIFVCSLATRNNISYKPF